MVIHKGFQSTERFHDGQVYQVEFLNAVYLVPCFWYYILMIYLMVQCQMFKFADDIKVYTEATWEVDTMTLQSDINRLQTHSN